MKKYIPLILLCFLAGVASSGFAQKKSPSLGLRLSTPYPTLSNAISLRINAPGERALEGIFSFGERLGLGMLYEKFISLKSPGFYWFYGVGGYVGFESKRTYFGPTGIAGLDYNFREIPLNLSLDLKPELDLAPKVSLIFYSVGLSARYVFP